MANTKRHAPSYSERPGNGRLFIKDLEILEALGENAGGMSPSGLMGLGSWAYIYRRLAYLLSLGLIEAVKDVHYSEGTRKAYKLTASGRKLYKGLSIVLSVIKGVD